MAKKIGMKNGSIDPSKNPFANELEDQDFFAVDETKYKSKIANRNKKNDEKSAFIFEKGESSATLEQEVLKGKALAILKGKKENQERHLVIDENDPKSLEFLEKEVRFSGEFVQPDPDAADALALTRTNGYKLEYNKKKQEAIRLKIRGLQDVIRTNLSPDDIKKIMNEFQHHVVKINKQEVILKSAKYGFEIYFNNADNRWWIVTLKFNEPFDPKQLNYVTHWVGNSFIGYGFVTLKECLEKTKEMLTRGRTGFIAWRDHMDRYDEKANRIYTSTSAPTPLTFKEYKKFVAWFKKNKIWIMVKKEGMKDSEDLMLEVREKRKRGEAVSPLAGVQAKLLEPPRKPMYITAYPITDPNYHGEEWEKPENKMYAVGFAFNE